MYGDTILDQLEEIRLSLLLGDLPKAKLEALSTIISRQKQAFKDPHLKEILLEIELRARVELAKFDRI